MTSNLHKLYAKIRDKLPDLPGTEPLHPDAEDCIKEDKPMRDQLSEKQIDKTVADSFPASDPPASY